MNDVVLIFPNQLFEYHPAIKKERIIFIAKDPSFYYGTDGNLKICQKKVNYHNSTIKNYLRFLKKKGHDARIIEFPEYKTKRKYSYYDYFKSAEVNTGRLFYCELPDIEIENKIESNFKKLKIEIKKISSPSYLFNENQINSILGKPEQYFFTKFYIKVRKKLNILIKNEKPEGEKWTFDSLNRKKIKENINLEYIDEKITGDFKFPDNFKSSRIWLEKFLEKKLKFFGDYQDAILKEKYTLFHSVLSPLLNIGLLTPEYVIRKTINFADHSSNIPLNSLEGFLRQIIGWREFMRAVYIKEGEKQKKYNYFEHKNKMPISFYQGNTGINPFDNTVKKLNESAYSHHIERLMILGNFMLLCEVDPYYIYKWFMELYIDAYDWVMVPNVYGMSQYADGGLITTKPYISSSNYILKMSDYKKGNWSYIWDSLFWRFIGKNNLKLSKNPRLRFVLRNYKKIDKNRLKKLFKTAEDFLSKL